MLSIDIIYRITFYLPFHEWLRLYRRISRDYDARADKYPPWSDYEIVRRRSFPFDSYLTACLIGGSWKRHPHFIESVAPLIEYVRIERKPLFIDVEKIDPIFAEVLFSRWARGDKRISTYMFQSALVNEEFRKTKVIPPPSMLTKSIICGMTEEEFAHMYLGAPYIPHICAQMRNRVRLYGQRWNDDEFLTWYHENRRRIEISYEYRGPVKSPSAYHSLWIKFDESEMSFCGFVSPQYVQAAIRGDVGVYDWLPTALAKSDPDFSSMRFPDPDMRCSEHNVDPWHCTECRKKRVIHTAVVRDIEPADFDYADDYEDLKW